MVLVKRRRSINQRTSLYCFRLEIRLHTENSRNREDILEDEAEYRAHCLNNHELFVRGAVGVGTRNDAKSAVIAFCDVAVIVAEAGFILPGSKKR